MAAATKRATKRAATRRAVKAVSKPHSFYTPAWTTACKDWTSRIRSRKPLTPCPPLFQDEADLGLSYFDELYMVDLGRKDDGSFHTFGEVSPQWVRDFVGAVFGCYCDIPDHPQRGRRLIKEFFMLISKKNSKSTIAAGIMLTALLQNWRDEAEFIILSPTKEIADNSFKPMAAAIENDPELSALLKVQSHIRTITHKTTKATIKVVAADSATVSGKKAVGVLIDELHEFGKIANAGKIFTEATGGLMSRPEGFIIYLTTQSSDPPAGVFKEKLDYARKVRDGIIDDPQFYPIIYEFPPEMLADEENKPYLKPENFYMTNPNLGYSVDEEYLVRKIQQAQDVSPKELQDVLAKHLNIQVGIQLADDNWPGAAVWLKTKAQPVTLAYLLAHSEVVAMGVDGGGLDDLFGLCALGRERGGHRLFAWFHAFAHSVVLDRRKEIAPRLLDFEKQGDLTTVEMVGDDAKRIAEYVKQVDDSGLLFGIGFDPNSLGGLLSDLEDVGISEEKCFRVNQGWKLAASIMGTERKLAACDIIHNHSSMMKWCVGNAKVELKGNAKVITKQKSGTAKIDPLMAMFNAMELMLTNPPAQYVDWDFSTMELIG